MPAATWTTVPPAKSRLPRSVSQPEPSALKTHAHDGMNTRVNQTGTKVTQPENFMRSATAPEIRAGVMQAKVRAKKTSRRSSPLTSRSSTLSNVPMKPLSVPVELRE